MTRVRFTVAALGLALLWVSGGARADDEKPTQRGARQRQGAARQRQGGARQRPDFGRLFGGGGPLLTKEEQEKLKLNDDQAAKVEKIVSAFEKDQKASMDKLREAMQKARDDGDRDAARGVFEKMRETTQANQKARDAAEDKIKGILTDEQKKKFDEIKKDRPQRPGFPGGGFPGGGFPGGGFPGRGSGVAPGQILPPFVQQRLELSDEQKEKLEKLQKEVDEKLQKILNDEQKKKLDELKRGVRDGGRPEGAGRPDQSQRPRRQRPPRSDLD